MNKESEGIKIHEAKTKSETIWIPIDGAGMHVYMCTTMKRGGDGYFWTDVIEDRARA